MRRLLVRFVADASGQDLIEYALLTTFIGLASIVGVALLRNAINLTYTSWNTSVYNLWEPPPPS
jgi:Flp pilus assembly pilin Flp